MFFAGSIHFRNRAQFFSFIDAVSGLMLVGARSESNARFDIRNPRDTVATQRV
jgi:hypothetical protein